MADFFNPTPILPSFCALKWHSNVQILCLLSFSWASLCGPPTYSETRKILVSIISDPISINGVLDETVWRQAPDIGDLIQREPDTGQAPSEKTEIKLLRDQNNL